MELRYTGGIEIYRWDSVPKVLTPGSTFFFCIAFSFFGQPIKKKEEEEDIFQGLRVTCNLVGKQNIKHRESNSKILKQQRSYQRVALD